MTTDIVTTVGQPNILVVDDDGEIRRLVAKFLRENGFHVLVARDGSEMKACLAQAHVDLIVLDVMLPGTNGLDLCRELRRSSSLPIIMLTAKGDDTDRIVGLEIRDCHSASGKRYIGLLGTHWRRLLGLSLCHR